MAYRILFADDDPRVCQVVPKMLATEPWSVTTVDNGRRAVDLLSREPFDVAVLDFFMPHYNGLEVLEQIRQQGIETDVVILTGYGTIELAVGALKAGARDFLTKPIQLDRIVGTIHRLLEERYPLHHVLANQLDAHVREHACQAELKPEDLCQHFRISERYMRRLFQKYLGTSFRQRLCYYRIERAKQMLAAEKVSLSGVAAQCGFKNPRRFAEAFRRLEGVSPKKFCEKVCR